MKKNSKCRIHKTELNGAVVVLLSLCLCVFAVNVAAQSGGQFTITQSVIAGGGSQSSAGQFALGSTSGQAVAGGPTPVARFVITSGFWNFTPPGPTAGEVSISGRVLTQTGRGLSGVRLVLRDAEGNSMSATTNTFGFYRFQNVPSGKTYILTVASRAFRFSPQALTVEDNMEGVNFVPGP
jgi:hypothetical protein